MSIKVEIDNDMQVRYRRQLDSLRWVETRSRIIDRSCGVCEQCKIKTPSFEIHHLEYHGDHPSDTPDDLLIALCPACHGYIHWQKRLAAYSSKKAEMVESGASFTEIENLVQEFGV